MSWTITGEFQGQRWTWTHTGPMAVVTLLAADGALELIPEDGTRWVLVIDP
jgi:hypothetical protein